MRRNRKGALPVLLASVVLVGCSDSATRGTVKGTVTLDGQPLGEGTVRFVPVDGASQTASAMVADGRFTATVPVGKMRVEFSAPKTVGRQRMYETPDSPVVDEVVELLPPRYNVQSELTLNVESGAQDAPFELSSR